MSTIAVSAWGGVSEIPDTLDRKVELKEVVVKYKREKYSKKNNPAVDFVNLIRERSDIGNPLLRDNYNYNKYERITIALNNITDTIGERKLLKRFAFLNEYVDTATVTGKPILPFSVKEKTSEVHHRANPSRTRELVTGINRRGLDDFANDDMVQTFLEEFFRDIDLYANDVTLLGNRFVSPLSKIGPDFYRYFLTDTVAVGADTCVVLSFAPRNNAMFGFVGRMYVPQGDSTMFVKRVTMRLSPNANVNFVESMQIEQTFERDSAGMRLMTSDDLSLEFSVIKGLQGMYARKFTTYSDHNFEPAPDPEIFSRLGQSYTKADAYLKDEAYWDRYREPGFKANERNVGDLVTAMRAVPLYYWAEKTVRLLANGFVPVWGDRIEMGPLNASISFNDLEGVRLRAGGMTTSELSKRWFSRAYVAYGTKDRKWKYRGEVEYSFTDKKRHSREWPMHSLRLTHGYDVDALGQHYDFTSADNVFLSFKSHADTMQIYRRQTRLDYFLELDNHLSFTVDLAHVRDEATRFVPFVWQNGTHARHLDFSTATLTVRYAPNEKFLQTRNFRFPVNSDAWVFQLSHTYGPGDCLGASRFTVNKTEAYVAKRFWFSAFGYLDMILKGGHVWSEVPFTQLLIPNANLSFTIQPESYALMLPMEFVSDSYASVDLTYWGNGILFNQIPLVKKLRLREVVGFRSYWGRLSDRNNPRVNTDLPIMPAHANPVEMSSRPYMEISAGLDNILRIIRLEYVWRLSYRHTPGASNSGLRFALHFTF